MIKLDEVGAFAAASTATGVDVRFGIYLPGIEPHDGYELLVRVIHNDDRFVPEIKTMDFLLAPVADHPLNLWTTEVTIPLMAQTHFGLPGVYLYRYQLLQTMPGTDTKRIITRWFTDPFARMTDVGELSAVVTPDALTDFVWSDDGWKVPVVDDLVVYEMHVEEFNSTFDGVIERLPYLKGLGISCLELMPVSSLKLDFDWGYGPLHYFAPNERWGGVQGLKRLVNACHAAGIAVILDVVYQHVDPSFPYHLVYADTGLHSPMIGADGPFGPQLDFSQEFTQEYVKAANLHWLHDYHVDGFRYDEVTDLYDGATGVQYAQIAYETYNESLTLPRFTPSGGSAAGEYSRIIQCPEALNRPQEILRSTYSNATWQDGLLSKAQDMAKFNYVDDAFVHLLDPQASGYPDAKTVHDIANQPVDMPVAPFQYFESHDNTQLIAFGGGAPGAGPTAGRSKFYKLQPFAIALYTCRGTPMLWQGQEFGESYVLPEQGDLRIHFRRDIHWEYFYDDFGAPLIRLYRILGRLRHACPALRSHDFFYDNTHSQAANGVVVYHRRATAAQQIVLVFLNFSDHPQTVAVPFPEPGSYREMIDEDTRTTPFEIAVSSAEELISVNVPSNYGYIFVK